MKRVFEVMTSALPLVIVGGLLYAGLFVKPQPKGGAVAQPIFERGDRFYGVAAQDDGSAWLAGSNGKIVHTSDAGRSWRLQPSPGRSTLQDIAAWDRLRAVAVGDGGVVLITSDGGAVWRSVDAPKSTIANKLLHVRTLEDGVAWAVGEGGSVLRSGDFGATWSQQGGQKDVAWNDIAFKEGSGWMVGEFGRIRRSGDGGATWEDITAPVKTSLMSVAFRDAAHGVAVGLNGVILSSDDGGKTWRQHSASAPPTMAPSGSAPNSATSYEQGQHEHLFAVTWDGTRWIAVGSKGVVVVGSGDALTWHGTRLSANDRNWYTVIARAGAQYYLAGSQVTTQPIGAI